MGAETTGTESQADEQESFGPAGKLDGISEKQRQEIDTQSRPNAALIHETIRAEGVSELERSSVALMLSGLAAGLSIGFSLVTQGLLHAALPEGPWRDLLGRTGYTIGFLIVVLGRQQLFTENTLTPILPLLHNRDAETLGRVLRLWGVVLLANVVGTWLFAAVIADTGIFQPDVKAAFAEISREEFKTPFWDTALKAVFAGWLIALMVWLLPAAETARTFVILLITYVIALGSFNHIIAGSVDGFYLVQTGEVSLASFVGRFFLPTLIGNIAGGVALVAVLNYGQVAPEIRGN
jgi:formate/nitrite transporter FocA (FNT family)